MKFIHIVGLALLLFGLTQCYAYVKLDMKVVNTTSGDVVYTYSENIWFDPNDPTYNYYEKNIPTEYGNITLNINDDTGDKHHLLVYGSATYSMYLSSDLKINYTIQDESGNIYIPTHGEEAYN